MPEWNTVKRLREGGWRKLPSYMTDCRNTLSPTRQKVSCPTKDTNIAVVILCGGSRLFIIMRPPLIQCTLEIYGTQRWILKLWNVEWDSFYRETGKIYSESLGGSVFFVLNTNRFPAWLYCLHDLIFFNFLRNYLLIWIIFTIFAASLVIASCKWPSGRASPWVGERAILYMRKTFSNVCRCDTRTSQIPSHNRQMTTETST